MYKFGKASTANLSECVKQLREVAEEAIQLVDFSILEGHRDEATQNKKFELGLSEKKFPNSKHNPFPSEAFDFAPYPINWKDERQFALVAGIIIGIGKAKGYVLRWGGDFNQNGKINDERFLDFGHIEFIRDLNQGS